MINVTENNEKSKNVGSFQIIQKHFKFCVPKRLFLGFTVSID